MTDRLWVDLDPDRRVSVSSWWAGEASSGPAGAPVPFSWPLEAEAMEGLRWYLEDYLRAPFGVYGDRGIEVADRLKGWGAAVFTSVFGSGAAQEAYLALRSRGGDAEVVFRSGAAELLGLPWELMWEPGRPAPLVLDGLRVGRCLPGGLSSQGGLNGLVGLSGPGGAGAAHGPGGTLTVPGDRLRVLMVIARPQGASDVGFRMVARPLLRRLDAVRGQVDLVVLRPPTPANLEKVLTAAKAAGSPFQVVHFDGHGMLDGSRAALVFEKPTGGALPVSADVVARVLEAAQVPLVVLNACQSGAVGKELEAAIATRLVQGGAASVVAMAYSVYAVAAAEFMAAFYERLFAGDGVGAAVGAGRERLLYRPERPSPKGPMALADWVIPVHYQQRELILPALRTDRPAQAPSLEAMLDLLRERPSAGEPGSRAEADDDPWAAVGEFVGRDDTFYRLEVALRSHRVAVLHGPGGTGKTEVAKAFARWWRDTGGLQASDALAWFSFEPGATSFALNAVVTSTGLQLFGTEFAKYDAAERLAVVSRMLAEYRVLLVWDNFESVASMPDPQAATPALSMREQREIKAFLALVASGGNSSVIVTSRTEETWLGNDVHRVELGGLAPGEVNEYADQVLAGSPAARSRRDRRAFGELLEWLDGHPLSMRLTLPRLEDTEPEALLAGLRGIGPAPQAAPQADGGQRTSSLAASITYSFQHLSPGAQDLLVVLALFQGVADADVLGYFSAAEQVPARFAGHDPQRWSEVLTEAADVGLLTALGAGMYRLHPALPAFLVARWRRNCPSEADFQRERAAADRALLLGHAGLGRWLSTQHAAAADPDLVQSVTELQRRTMGRMIALGLELGEYSLAETVLRPLNDFWDVRGLLVEGQEWVQRVRAAVESPPGQAPGLDTEAGSLWLFTVGGEGNRYLRAGRRDDAERTYRTVIAALRAQPLTDHVKGNLAVFYHQLGMVASDRGQQDEAARWFRESLALKEERGDRAALGSSYHQLGNTAYLQGELDEAEQWYARELAVLEPDDRAGAARTHHQLAMVAHLRGELDEAEQRYGKALSIAQELGNLPEIATVYQQLGAVAQDRETFDEAIEWYGRSLAIVEELGDRVSTAMVYHQLGLVAQLQDRLDEAEQWYRRSLAIKEALADRAGTASGYHQLGTVAHERGQWDEAEAWYHRSLTIEAELGNVAGVIASYGRLGLLEDARGRPVQAMEWMVRCIGVFGEFPHPGSGPAPVFLRLLTRQLGLRTLKRTWVQVTGRSLPRAVRSYVQSPD